MWGKGRPGKTTPTHNLTIYTCCWAVHTILSRPYPARLMGAVGGGVMAEVTQ